VIWNFKLSNKGVAFSPREGMILEWEGKRYDLADAHLSIGRQFKNDIVIRNCLPSDYSRSQDVLPSIISALTVIH